jgi:predicted transglutaminase-like cysteine proteinase
LWTKASHRQRSRNSLQSTISSTAADSVSDPEHWQPDDYWATPIEFLATDRGDYEDFSLAKYFTLTALGIPKDNLRITYVNARSISQAHMVVTYYAQPGAEPLVLDNLVPGIKPASRRRDLTPVFSFNGNQLCGAKQRGRGSYSIKNVWDDFISRMHEQMAPT